MGKYNIHPDFQKYEKLRFVMNPVLLAVMNTLMTLGQNAQKPSEGTRMTRKQIPGYQGEPIGISVVKPENISDRAPCLIYFHGGAFVLRAAPFHLQLISEYALKTPCVAVFVDYRVDARHMFPVGVEDCYAAYSWVCANSEELGIDPDRIAVGGDSAGGALAAAVSQMARDRKAGRICFQMLIYPVTDARQNTESMRNFTDTPVWNAKLTEKMWKAYLRNEDAGPRAYASPMEAVSLTGLPDAYVEVAEFDCLRDEGILYAEALMKAGSAVELNKPAGTIHAFEIAMKSETTLQCVARRIAALTRAFYPGKPPA